MRDSAKKFYEREFYQEHLYRLRLEHYRCGNIDTKHSARIGEQHKAERQEGPESQLDVDSSESHDDSTKTSNKRKRQTSAGHWCFRFSAVTAPLPSPLQADGPNFIWGPEPGYGLTFL